MLKTYLENIFLASVPIFTVTHNYDMSIHSLLAVVLMHEDSIPKYYIGSGMILATTYSYFATHEHLKILFSIILAFTLMGCGFTNEMRKIESSYSSSTNTCAVDTEEELLPASPVSGCTGSVNCTSKLGPGNYCNCEYAPSDDYMDWMNRRPLPPPAEELPSPAEELPPPAEELPSPAEELPPPAEEPPTPPPEELPTPPPAEELRSTEKKRPRIVAKLATII